MDDFVLVEVVPLPLSVEQMIGKICFDQNQPPPDTTARQKLASLGEKASLEILNIISQSRIRETFSGYIIHLAKKCPPATAADGSETADSVFLSPSKRPAASITSLENCPAAPGGADFVTADTAFSPPSKRPVTSLSSLGADDYIYGSPFQRQLIKSPASNLERTNIPIMAHFPPTSGTHSHRPSTSMTPHFSPFASLERPNTIIAAQFSPSSGTHWSSTPVAPPHTLSSPVSNSKMPNNPSEHLVHSPYSNSERSNTSVVKRSLFSPSSSLERESTHAISQQMLILLELEFRRTFLVLNYIGRRKLEDVISVEDAFKILEMKDTPMTIFEGKIWSTYGRRCLVGKESTDRRKYLDWNSGKTHNYNCQVYHDGSCSFQGPFLNTTGTHLQRSLGDENVLIVKFEQLPMDPSNFSACSGNYNAAYIKIAEEGILIGQRRYRFFVFKDGKEGKQKSQFSSAVKCYFVRMESIAPCDEKEPYILSNCKSMREARCLFMHLDTISSMAKYASRCSLLLSKTIKLQVDLTSVHIERIEDIPCSDEYGCSVWENGDLKIHTDGTGYISEDLAMKCPRGFNNAKFLKDENLELENKSSGGQVTVACVREPPLLMQCRLFHNGIAVKGTLLLNRKLPHGTIKIRRSMIKVKADSSRRDASSFNSLELIKISGKPRRPTLSRYLIALLSYGGVPNELFLDLLMTALEDAHSLYSNKRVALRVAMNHGDIDDDFMTARMLLSGVPLNEPCVQHRLSRLASEERKGLQAGRLPIKESYNLIGTADPTGLLNSDEVCVILDNGQISGKVLVYRHPGLHFGDIHVLNAVYKKELEDVVGNAKYGIFFSTKGQRSVASEIANGDFDGDMYWVSRNHQLLDHFKPSTPWTRLHPPPKAFHRKPSDLSSDELEHELFEQFLNSKKQSISMGVAADSWLAFMDKLLTLGDGCGNVKNLERNILKLVDIYYDALDAPKSGKKVVVPNHLKAETYPHYMERPNPFHSTSILGLIYETVLATQAEKSSIEEIWKLPSFDHVEIPDDSWKRWKENYDNYRKDMTEAMSSKDEFGKSSSADDVTKKYKEVLYGATDFEGSPRETENVYKDALALYHVTYDYAKLRGDVGKCNFAWKVAGSALCKFHAMKAGEKSTFLCVPSVLQELLH